MSTKSNIKKIDAINNKINDFRKYFTNRYDEANNNYNAYIKNKVEKFYDKPSNANKIYKGKENPEFDMNTSTILAPYLIQWEALINEYKTLTGQEYKKPIIYNVNKEESLKANQLEKAAAREARDALIAQKEAKAKLVAKPVDKKKLRKDKAKQELLQQYNITEKEYDKLVNDALKNNMTIYDALKDDMYIKNLKKNIPLEEVVLPTATVSLIKKGLFSDMKDLVNTIIESQSNIKGMQKSEEIAQLKSIEQKLNKIPENVIIIPVEEDIKVKRKAVRAEKKANLPELQPWYPEEHGNRDRTGKLMSDEEIAQLKRIREKLKQSKIPENVIVSPIKEEVKRKRGRPVVEGSKRQAKLASTEPVIPKRRGRPPKKVIIEETKEETRAEETKEDIAPKRKRGRPIVEGSKRQARLAVVEPKKPRGRPKKTAESNIENVEPKQTKAGRPSKCASVMPKNNELTKNIFSKPVIEWIDIDKKHKLLASQYVNPLLLKYSKMNKNLFFDIMNTLTKQRLASRIKGDIKKNPTKNDLFIIYRKICEFAIFYGFTTAYEIEQSLITRIVGDLQDKPKELKRFLSFLKKNCIGKQSGEPIKKTSKEPNDKNKVYPLQNLTVFYEVPLEGKILKDKSIDEIFKDVYVGKNASIRMNDDKIEVVDYEDDEEGNPTTNKEWKKINLKKTLLKGLVKRIIDAVKVTVDEDTYKVFIKDYNDDPQYIYDLILERIPEK